MGKIFEQDEIFVDSEYELPKLVSRQLVYNLLNSRESVLPSELLSSRIIERINDFYFIFIFVKIKGYNLSVTTHQSTSIDSRQELDEATDIFYSLIRDDTASVLCNVNGYRAILLELAPQPGREEITQTDKFAQYLEELRLAVIERCGYPIQLVASERSHGCSNLPRCFHIALFALDFIFEIYKDKNIERIEGLNDLSPSLSLHAPKKAWEEMYLRALLDYNFRKARVILYDLITDELRDPITALNIRVRIQNRMLWTLSALDVPMNSASMECNRIYTALRQIISSKTIGEFYGYIDSIFQDLASFYNQHTVNTAQKLEMIVNYIKENYADPTLSATGISEKFNINNAYLSRAFKKETGVKLIDFIHHVRIDSSKQLLLSDMTMDEIASAVGYYSASSFIRAFKRLEGAPPGTYRKNSLNPPFAQS